MPCKFWYHHLLIWYVFYILNTIALTGLANVSVGIIKIEPFRKCDVYNTVLLSVILILCIGSSGPISSLQAYFLITRSQYNLLGWYLVIFWIFIYCVFCTEMQHVWSWVTFFLGCFNCRSKGPSGKNLVWFSHVSVSTWESSTCTQV